MVGRRRNPQRSGVVDRASASLRAAAPARSRSTRSGAATRAGVPEVVQQMLAEAGSSPVRRRQDVSEPPLKRPKRPGQRSDPSPRIASALEAVDAEDDEDSDDEDIEFEDVKLPAPVIQTTELDSDDSESEDDEILFEDVRLDLSALESPSDENKPKDLELNLSAHQAARTPRKTVDRRKPITRAERERRIEVHKMHLLCLLAHVARRNHWCNDSRVQKSLRPLLTDKMIKYLNPSASLPQFGRTESLKNGLQQVSSLFRTKFSITERGMKRALWAEDAEHLQSYELPDDLESVMEKEDFREAARTLRGSRDVGAQLFCSLLRAAGVEARLVCSLQPLAFAPGAPALPKPKPKKSQTPSKKATPSQPLPSIYQDRQPDESPVTATSSPRRRLGHPQAAAYNVPSLTSPSPRSPSVSRHHHEAPPSSSKRKILHESPFPIYWVEVLDVAHQRWQPVDPLVTQTQWKPAKLEPPAADRDNILAYAIAFAEDGTARDVTRRYAKAYASKTRRLRVDGGLLPSSSSSSSSSSAFPDAGARWLRRALRAYARPGGSSSATDLDQIEDTELAALEAREPMPRGIADFKDHPVFALERHLRRHEVLAPGASVAGTVSAGSRAPLERIYRRRDVRIARSADKWYRLGRVVLPGEIPAKWLPKRAAARKGKGSSLFRGTRAGEEMDEDEDEDDEEEDPVLGPGEHPEPNGTPLFTTEQTELYVPPPVRDGRVPRNKFGNVDVYVPSMVPAGGAHVSDERAARAAFLLGIDYAPALTGFQFKGRHGTAVLRGVVVPRESEEAVRAVVAALGDLEAEAEAERKARAAVRMWSRLLKGLRIRERIWTAAEERGEEGVREGEEEVAGQQQEGEDDEDDDVVDEEGPEARRRRKGKGRAIVSESEEGEEGGVQEGLESDVTEEYDMMDDDEGGGGFLIE